MDEEDTSVNIIHGGKTTGVSGIDARVAWGWCIWAAEDWATSDFQL